MGEPKQLTFPPRGAHDIGPRRSGVDVTYVKRRRVLNIGAWYDTYVGIETTEIYLGVFLRDLGITLSDCKTALREMDNE